MADDFTADATQTDTDPDAAIRQFLQNVQVTPIAGPPGSSAPSKQPYGPQQPQAAAPSSDQKPGSSSLTPNIDWSKLGEMELNSRLAELDAKFPHGLRHDRHYTVEDTAYRDPSMLTGSYGGNKNQSHMVTNPITGTAMPLPPGVSAQMVTMMANSLVEAKARARADVIRGKQSDDAAVTAMAHAFGVDPEAVKGMPLDFASKILPAYAHTMQQKQKQDQELTDRNQQQQAFGQIEPGAAAATSGITNPSIAEQVFTRAIEVGNTQARAKAAEDKAALAEENKGKLAGAISELDEMPAADAARLAAQKLTPFLDPRSLHYAGLVTHYQTRAKQEQDQAFKDSEAQRHQQDFEQRQSLKEQQTQQKAFATDIGKPIDSIISPSTKPKSKIGAKSGFASAGGEVSKADLDYSGPILDQLASIRMLASNAERHGISNFPQVLQQAMDLVKNSVPGDTYPEWLNDPQSILMDTKPAQDKDQRRAHLTLTTLGMALKQMLSRAPATQAQ